jgi:hypothetical protein
MVMHQINLEEVDTDGAIREAAEAVAGDTRISFLRKAAVAGGAFVGGGAMLSAMAPGTALASTYGGPSYDRPTGKDMGTGDIAILNYALTLEYLERAFYNRATYFGKIKSPQLVKFLKVVTRDERAHVEFLKSALGKRAIPLPKFDFKGIPEDEAKFAATAQVLENTGVHAYLGQLLNIQTPAYALAAGTIVTIEARHAGAIGLINHSGGGIAPSGTLDVPEGASEILKAVKGTGFIK